MGIEENEEMDEFDTVTLEMEDGSEVEFAILDEFEMETEKFVLLGEIEGDNINTDPDGMLFMKAIMDESCEEDEVILKSSRILKNTAQLLTFMLNWIN